MSLFLTQFGLQAWLTRDHTTGKPHAPAELPLSKLLSVLVKPGFCVWAFVRLLLELQGGRRLSIKGGW